MRIWDIHPGYLSRQRLLGEHRELHAIYSILVHQKKGYSRHPETIRWQGKLPALIRRHDALVAEMELRGYRHLSPVEPVENIDGASFQGEYVDEPAIQFQLLRSKYIPPEQGRIPLPNNAQQLWAHHKYSILARDPGLYNEIGPKISQKPGQESFAEWSKRLTEALQTIPPPGRLLNAIQHMWGYISSFPETPPASGDMNEMLQTIQKSAVQHDIGYLLHSTALSELTLFIPRSPEPPPGLK